MYARLWWKDLRQFWPIWIFLVLAAVVVQMSVLVISGPNGNQDWFQLLSAMAMGWTCLYALAVGAAAFAGEREAGTLKLLDIIPISRSVVWSGKVSFGIATTLAMAIVLLIVAMLGAAGTPAAYAESAQSSDAFTRVLALGLVVFEALGWGLLASAILSNAITAAVAAVCCTGVAWSIATGSLDDLFLPGSSLLSGQLLLVNFIVVVATIAISNLAFTRTWKLFGVPIAFRSPVVITGTRSPRVRQTPSQIQPAPATPWLSAIGTAVRGTGAQTLFRPGERSRFSETRVLVWQTIREGRAIWLLLVPISLIVPWVIAGTPQVGWYAMINAAVALTAGVSVFGIQHRANTQRFLVHHGARAGLVWLVKVGVWLFGLAVIWSILALAAYLLNRQFVRNVANLDRPAYVWALLTLTGVASVFVGVFAISMLCGMAVRRGITAWVLAMVAAGAIVSPAVALLYSDMLPMWSLAVVPPAFLLISWLWSGDWLYDRPAPGRWIRLGLMLTVTITTLFGGYVAIRAWGVPDSPPIPAPRTWANLTPEPVPTDRDAAPIYREAMRLYRKLQDYEVVDIDPGTGVESKAKARPAPNQKSDEQPELLRRQILSYLHQAAARPEYRFFDPSRLSINSVMDVPPIGELALLVKQEFSGRMRQNNLAGAWEDVEVLFRMAHQLSLLATGWTAQQALIVEYDAINLARQWVLDPETKQTRETLRAAMTAYQNLPKVSSSDEVLKGFARYTELSIDEVDEYKIIQLNGSSRSPDKPPPLTSVLHAWLISPSWERERARRLARISFADLSRYAALEPFQRDLHRRNFYQLHGRNFYQFQDAYSSSPLLRLLFPWTISYLTQEDANLVARRALVQIMAIRAWQLEHDGQFPPKLENLVPSELSALPLDPYSGQPFQFRDASLSPIFPDPTWPESFKPTTWPEGTHLLYSVGQNQVDDLGREYPPGWMRGDLLFGVPPIKSTAPISDRPASAKPDVDKTPAQKPKP
jgi:ABC-type transport system involved in multi-copper enzyme maturation permease subunit